MDCRKSAAILCCLALVILVAGPHLATIGSGVWQFDYQIDGIKVNGEAYGFTDSTDTTADPADYDFFGGGFPWWLSIIGQNAYFIQVDPDDNPRIENNRWVGLASDVYAEMSGAYRVDSAGLRVPFDYADPYQVSHETDTGTQYEYYYQFSIRCGTDSDQVMLPGSSWYSYECSSVEADVQVTLVMRKSIFASQVKGEFADAYVVDYNFIDLQLQSGLDFEIQPAVSPGAINAQLTITNRQQADDQYLCVIHVPFGMQSGLSRSGDSLNRYDVWITKIIRMTLLLEEPLDIGSQADDLTGGDAPVYVPPYDWRLVIIIAVIIVVILAWAFLSGRRKEVNVNVNK